ncbi:MAG TPA: hypothetical protein VFG07_09135 [Thermoplasmata archaeon]|nr:hypothetical protein [Thermoplasmata archaeon]
MKDATRRIRWAAAAILGVLFLTSLAAGEDPASPPPSPVHVSSSAGDLVGTVDGSLLGDVTWNGIETSTASTMSSAIGTGFASVVDVRYTWSSIGIAGQGGFVPKFNISVARLQFVYFGTALTTRDVVDSGPQLAVNGSFDMAWDPGLLHYLVAGSYTMVASLIAPNGTTMWNEQFFLRVTALAAVGAVIPLLLLIIGAVEGYSLARSGRESAVVPSATPTVRPATPGGGAEAPPVAKETGLPASEEDP